MPVHDVYRAGRFELQSETAGPRWCRTDRCVLLLDASETQHEAVRVQVVQDRPFASFVAGRVLIVDTADTQHRVRYLQMLWIGE